MQDNVSKFDAGRAWSDAMAMLKGQREILLTVAGFFILLPSLLLESLRPFAGSGSSETWMRELAAWTEANFVWILLVALLAALGRLTILILLLWPDRPTVGEALGAAARMLIPFAAMDLLIGFMLLGGFMLFILPGFYIFGRTFLAEAAFVARRARGPIAGLTAGFEASRGNGWRLFAAIAIIYIGGTILTAAVSSVVGVLAALTGGSDLDRVLSALVESAGGAGISLVLLLVAISAWRQLAEQRDVRSGVAR